MKIGLYQHSIIWQDPEQNLRVLKDHLKFLGKNSPDLLVLPELCTTGFSPDSARHCGAFPQGEK